MIDQIKNVYRVVPVETKYQKRPQEKPLRWGGNERRKKQDRRGSRIENRSVYEMRNNLGRRKGDRKRSLIEVRV